MIKIALCYVLGASMAILALGAQSTTHTKKAASKTAVAKKSTATARKTGKKTVAPVKRTTWRNRQLAPSPERYKEIQDALVAKGYLKPEDTGGSWNQNSVDALKKFQSEQNLDASGKINSLSLIALGLGPKHETPAKPAEAPQDR